MKKNPWRGLAALICLAALPALAHHSTAEFDYTRVYRVEGTVKEFQWTNPHSWLQVRVPRPGTDIIEEWGFELGAPLFNARMGWRKDSVRAGQRVIVLFCPSRTPARGTLMRVLMPDGSTLNGLANSFFRGPAITNPADVAFAPPPEAP